MRRAMRHAHLLGTKDPLMHRLVPALVGEMGSAYPELKRSEPLIAETLKLEEIRFRETLARGLKLKVVAEGVETAGQLAILRGMACDEYQGFLFSPPVEQDAVPALMRRYC